MSKQIDELMALADEYMVQERDGTNGFEARQALKQALEAALKPGEPVAWRLWDDEPGGEPVWRYYDRSDFRTGVNPQDFFNSLVPLYTAPPAQTPPPRLTDDEVIEIAKLGWWKSDSDITSDGLDIARAIETAVRKQFGVQE